MYIKKYGLIILKITKRAYTKSKRSQIKSFTEY